MEKIEEKKQILYDEVYISESMLVGILWNKPILFATYNTEKLSQIHFGNKIWGFYLGLGREMFKRGIQVFDEITASKVVNEHNMQTRFKYYGEYETIEELMYMTKDIVENIEGYYDDVKKYSFLRSLYDIIGDNIFVITKKYNYKKMNKNEISDYWSNKFIRVQAENGESRIKDYNLLGGLNELLTKLDDDNNVGIPFYKLNHFSNIMNGWTKGVVYLMSAFSGMGKSSFVVFGIIMSFISRKEKLVIIANEMDIEAYQKLLLITVMGTPLYDELYQQYKKDFNRNNLDKGKFTENEKKRLEFAIDWIKENVDDENLIKFIPIEHYTMQSVEEVLRLYKSEGYDYAVIDTCKPSENRGNKERWVQFVDDFETIYKLAKKDTLDMGIFTTVQNADSYINVKYLDYSCIGDGKKIKNTVDLCTHIRPMFDSEKKGDSALVVTDGNGDIVKINPMKTYYLLFVSKNRRGLTNLNNLPILVMSVDLNRNSWKEIGWTKISNDNQ